MSNPMESRGAPGQQINHTREARRIRAEAKKARRPLSDKARESARVLATYVEARDDPDSRLELPLPEMTEREAWAVGDEVAGLFLELYPSLPDVRGWSMSYHDAPDFMVGPYLDLDALRSA